MSHLNRDNGQLHFEVSFLLHSILMLDTSHPVARLQEQRKLHVSYYASVRGALSPHCPFIKIVAAPNRQSLEGSLAKAQFECEI